MKTLSQDNESEIRSLLMGRRIVAAEMGSFETGQPWPSIASGRLTLDDGTQVLVVPNEGGCSCSAGDYELTHLATVDNIITDVRLAEESFTDSDGYDGGTRYRIYVIADAVEINAVTIDGDDGSGYYGTGYELIVLPAGSLQTNESEQAK